MEIFIDKIGEILLKLIKVLLWDWKVIEKLLRVKEEKEWLLRYFK